MPKSRHWRRRSEEADHVDDVLLRQAPARATVQPKPRSRPLVALHTTPDKARCAIIRRDRGGYNRYQAELRYRNYGQRVVRGMRADYVVLDEEHVTILQGSVDRMVGRMELAARTHAYPPSL